MPCANDLRRKLCSAIVTKEATFRSPLKRRAFYGKLTSPNLISTSTSPCFSRASSRLLIPIRCSQDKQFTICLHTVETRSFRAYLSWSSPSRMLSIRETGRLFALRWKYCSICSGPAIRWVMDERFSWRILEDREFCMHNELSINLLDPIKSFARCIVN